MSVRSRIAKRRLTAALSRIPDALLLKLIWATDGIQSDNLDNASAYISYPEAAATTDPSSYYLIYKWELETLANLSFLVEKSQRSVDFEALSSWDKFHDIARIIQFLRKAENLESADFLPRFSTFAEINRIAYRQFPWQRNQADLAGFYRSVFVYGTGNCANYFHEKHGFSIENFTLWCFALHAVSLASPYTAAPISLTDLQVTSEMIEKCLGIVGRDFVSIRAEAASLNQTISDSISHELPIAYQPSILRKFPALVEPRLGPAVIVPLPNLLLERCTSGLYYDMVGVPKALSKEISKRFERYTIQFLNKIYPEISISGEFEYGPKKAKFDSPDALAQFDYNSLVVMECKSTKLPFGGKFSENPLFEAPSKYDEIAKGIYQLWRFFSHVRQGIVPAVSKDTSIIGIVVTMDMWFTMNKKLLAELYKSASTMIKSADDIGKRDKRNIVICSIRELEEVSMLLEREHFLGCVEQATEEHYAGWMLSNVARKICNNRRHSNQYPFDLCSLLPWHQKVLDIAREQ